MLVHFLYMKNKEMGSKGGHKLEQCYFCIDIIGTGGYMFFFFLWFKEQLLLFGINWLFQPGWFHVDLKFAEQLWFLASLCNCVCKNCNIIFKVQFFLFKGPIDDFVHAETYSSLRSMLTFLFICRSCLFVSWLRTWFPAYII